MTIAAMAADTTCHAVIASLDEARAAISTARSRGVAAELDTPPDAAAIYGVLWFTEMNRMLKEEFPDTPFTLTLDCADRADFAHAALVEGLRSIKLRGHPRAVAAIKSIAAQLGARVEDSLDPLDRH